MVTIYDIAKATGVAKSTVANALSGKGSVSAATRQRILQCAQEMGYRPNLLARSLYNHKTLTIAVFLPTATNPFYPQILEAIEHTMREYAYQTLFCITHQDFALGRQQMELMMSRWVDGYIVMGASMDIVDITRYFQQSLPMVLCDWQENETPQDIPQVAVDFYRAGQLAALHLLDLEHQQVAVIVDELQHPLRLEGFLSVLQEQGITLPRERIQHGQSSLKDGYAAARVLLAQPQRPTAIFATNDWMAIGAIEAIMDEGLQVPQDISVIGLDDIALASYLRPPLTTIAIPTFQLAKETTALLFKQINGEKTISAPPLVEPYLILRQSTAFSAFPPIV